METADPAVTFLQDAALSALDFSKIREHWRSACAHVYGERYVDHVSPWVSAEEVQLRLLESAAVGARLQSGAVLPLTPLPDITELLHLAAKPEALLSGSEIRRVILVLEALTGYADFCQGAGGLLQEQEPLLRPNSQLLARLRESIDSDGILLDSASPALGSLRSQLRRQRNQVQQQLQSLLRDRDRREIWQENSIVQRGGRYVLPVKANFKGRLKGIVHDRSASGETLFMEPLDLIEANNQLVELQAAEQGEEERILRSLTAWLGKEAQACANALQVMGRMDAIRAGLELGSRWQGEFPVFVGQACFDLQELRHPLLMLHHGDRVVANDLALGNSTWQILITGPNTGGKSALLKAVGLVHLLTFLGLPVPARGQVGYFRQIFTVFGDAQDIQADLSSFSGQMQQVRRILALADDQSLALLDELGNGTDPREGAALAQAVVAELGRRRCRTLLSSHMAVLKRYALQQEGVQLGGMGFDLESLRPTYRLQLGVAGSSQGLRIARRIGLPPVVLAQAEALHASEQENWEGWEARREALLQEAEEKLAQARQLVLEQETLRSQAAKELQRVAEERQRAARMEQAKWEQLLRDARQQVRTAIATLKQGRNTQAVSALLDDLDKRMPKPPEDTVPLPVVGERGLFLPLRVPVEIQRVDPAAGRLQIAVRGKLLWIPAAQFQPDAKLQLPRERGRSQYAAPENQPWRLDLRGQRREEAELTLLRYVDDAIAAGRGQIVILHGTGDGILAEMVRTFAREDPRVLAWRMAAPEQGGGGVSELELR